VKQEKSGAQLSSVVVGSLGPTCDVSQLLGGRLTVGGVARHACYHLWPMTRTLLTLPGRLQCLWSCLVVHSVRWSLHCIGRVTLPPTTQWLHQNPSSSHRLPRGNNGRHTDGRLPASRRWPAGVSKHYVGVWALSALSAGCKYCQVSGGIMLISSSTACKRPQVFLLFRKLKSTIKDWPTPTVS